ncbi:PAS domain-containing protein [Undibacterium sp. Rencai35W]|uniref:PAS domain-containing protein n=1 Tax=Undibacterium sp. Rencai35W TaxID=3413046 RepID=UPI003BF34C6D
MPSRLPDAGATGSSDAASPLVQAGERAAGRSLRALLEAIGDSLWDWNLITNETFFSRRYKKILGYAEHEMGQHIDDWLSHVHPDDVGHAMAATRRHLEGQTPDYEDEHRMRCRDGSWKWVRSRGAVVERNADGQPIRMMGLITDITQNRQLTDQLKESHTLLSNFSRYLPGVFYQFQRFPDGRFCFPYASQAVVDVFGIQPEQLREDASALFSKIHPDDVPAMVNGVRISAMELSQWHHEYRVLQTDGTARWYVGNATPEHMTDGSILWHGFLSDITERKQAEERAYKAEQQIRLILKASNQGLYDINILTGEGQYSPEYARMLGYDADEFASQPEFWNNFWKSGIHPDDIPRLKTALRNHIKAEDGSDYQAEFRQKTKSGEWIWIMSRGRIVERDSQGRAVRMQGTHIDITERKVSEEMLRVNQELLQASKDRYKLLARELDILINNAPVGIMFVSDGVIIRANKVLADLCRFDDVQAMIGKKTTFLYADENDYHAFGAQVIPQLQRDEPVEIEWQVKRISGEPFLARIAGRALPPENYVRGTVWMMEDITDQRRTMDALKQSEQRLQRLINSSLIGIAQGGENGQLNDVNDVFAQLCGHTREHLLSRQRVWEFLLSEADILVCQHAYAELLSAGTTAPFEVTLKHPGGHDIPILVGLSHLENSRSEWVVFAMDISERHRINQLKSEFISVVSHELRTPLTSIRGSLGILDSGIAGVLPEKVGQLIKIAHHNSLRLIDLVNDILDMDKLVSGKMRFKSEPVDLVSLVAGAVEANQAYAQTLKVSLRFVASIETAWVLADSDRLMQVMANLLSNAAKFSPEGEVVDIEIAGISRDEHSSYRITVSDKGPGIPPEFQSHLYEPFTQADGTDTRRQGGTGLGLPITKTLVEKMNGQLGFTTGSGSGTQFWCEFFCSTGTKTDQIK